MHTDISTNCTLLGPVDCDSFYKWIPLNRWPVAISSEVLHFIYCAISISLSLIYVHHIIHCLFTAFRMTELVVKCERDGRFVSFYTPVWCLGNEREAEKTIGNSNSIVITLWLAVGKALCFSHAHILPVLQFFFFLINIFKCFHLKIVKANHISLTCQPNGVTCRFIMSLMSLYHA